MSQAEETLERLRKQAEGEGNGEEEEAIEPEDAEEDQGTIAEPQEAEAKKSSSRDYIVLVETQPNRFEMLGDAHASSGESAILSFGDKLKSGVSYYAVPSRNWTKATPKVETKTTITLE